MAIACLVFYVSTCELRHEKGSFTNSGDQAVRSMSLFYTKNDSMSHCKCFYLQNEHPPSSLISVYPHPKKIVNHQNQAVQGFKKTYFSKIRVAMFQVYRRKIRKRNTRENTSKPESQKWQEEEVSVINHGPENPKGIMKKCECGGYRNKIRWPSISQLIRKMYIKGRK